jgi:hypothetical protein
VSEVDTTQESWNNAGPLVDIDEIEPDESLLADVRKTRITTPVTRGLLVLIVLSLGFLGGAWVDRWQRPSSSSTSSLSSLISQFRRGGAGASGASGTSGASGAFGASGAAAFFGGGGGGTTGTIKVVDGKNVYIQDSAGDDIKVTTTPSTQITVSKPGTVGQLLVGSTVRVSGTASSDGTSIAATSISPGIARTLGRGGGGTSSAAGG